MRYVAHLTWLRENIPLLDYKQQLLFGYLCVHRLLPNYCYFSRQENWGDPAVLEGAAERVRSGLSGDAVDAIEIEREIASVDAQIPDMDDFGSTVYGSHALDAGTGTVLLLEFLREPDAGKIIEIGEYAMETVIMNVTDREGYVYGNPDYEENVSTYPLMQREMETQKKQYEKIKVSARVDDALIEALLREQHNGGKSNVDLR